MSFCLTDNKPLCSDSGLSSQDSDTSPDTGSATLTSFDSHTCGSLKPTKSFRSTSDRRNPGLTITCHNMTMCDKGKIFAVHYYGQSTLDRRYTHPMLPWILCEIRRQNDRKPVKVELMGQTLKATSMESENVLLEHKLQSLTKFFRSQQDPSCFAYLTRTNAENPFTCHVFQAEEEGVVSI